MIGVSKLYCGAVEAGDVLRYRDRRAQDLPSHLLQFSADKKPVVVWNVTKQCNLKCLHCYAKATAGAAPDELSHAEGLALLQDLKDFGVPVVLFSGGEPLMRPDLPELVEWTVTHGMRAVISTNGTLITAEMARRLQRPGPVLRGHQPGRHRRHPRPVPGRTRGLCRGHGRGAQLPGGGPQGGTALHGEPPQLSGSAGHLRPGGGI